MSRASGDRRYVRFVGASALAVGVALALGALPTRRLGGERALVAMTIGGAIAWISAALGAWPLLRSPAMTPNERLQGMLQAMGIRAVVAIGLAALVIMAGDFDRRSLLLWLALTYGLLLALEVRFALRAS